MQKLKFDTGSSSSCDPWLRHGLNYRMRRWYDTWTVVFRFAGSVWPRALIGVFLSCGLSVIYWFFVTAKGLNKPPVVVNPMVFGFYLQTVGIILAFTMSISYNKYWEALSSSCQMMQTLRLISSMIIAFDRGLEPTAGLETVNEWKAEALHLISILHAVSIQSLLPVTEGQALEILGALTPNELEQLNNTVEIPTTAFHWLNDCLSSRSATGGIKIRNDPAVAQLWTQLGNFMTVYMSAYKVSAFRLPLSFHQALVLGDIATLTLAPLAVAAFVPNLIVCIAFTFVTAAAFHGMFLANIAMQQPFGAKSGDLPLLSLHQAFLSSLYTVSNPELLKTIHNNYPSEWIVNKSKSSSDYFRQKLTPANLIARLDMTNSSKFQTPSKHKSSIHIEIEPWSTVATSQE